MTANTSIIIEQKEKVLRLPNAALRFKMPDAGMGKGAENSSAKESKTSKPNKSDSNTTSATTDKSSLKPYGGMPKATSRKVWVLEEGGLKKKPVQKTIQVGLSDGTASEILPTENGESSLKVGDQVIIGVQKTGGSEAARPTGPRFF